MNSEGAVHEEVHRGGALARSSYREATCQTGWDGPHHARETPSDSASLPPRRWGRSMWWSVGGAVLSVVGFVCLALFEQYNSGLSELRADLKHFNEVSGEFVKRDVVKRLGEHIKESRQELQESRSARVELERELALSKKDREEMLREIQRLRERLASVEGRQAATPIVVPLPTPASRPNSADHPPGQRSTPDPDQPN